MPQLDPYIFMSQLVWLFFLFFSLYYFISQIGLTRLYEFCWVQAKLSLQRLRVGLTKKEKAFNFEFKNVGIQKDYELASSEFRLENKVYKLKK